MDIQPLELNDITFLTDLQPTGWTFGEGIILANTNLAGIELMKLRLKSKDNAAFPIDNLSATEFSHQQNFRI